MSLPEKVLKLFEKSIDMIGDEDGEFPDEDFSNIFKDTFKTILKETSKSSKSSKSSKMDMDMEELKKLLDELEAENKTLKERVAELEYQLVTKIAPELD
jgi:phosphoglycerate-specific signal transduction histidine kinase